jgi:hypothetical protein
MSYDLACARPVVSFVVVLRHVMLCEVLRRVGLHSAGRGYRM